MKAGTKFAYPSGQEQRTTLLSGHGRQKRAALCHTTGANANAAVAAATTTAAAISMTGPALVPLPLGRD